MSDQHRPFRRDKGMLVVISGFSGSGKGTLMKGLMQNYDYYSLSISATTRAPRPGEEEGREYFFVDRERFLTMIQNGELLEYARYVDNYYGTPKSYVEQELAKGKDVILEIEMHIGIQRTEAQEGCFRQGKGSLRRSGRSDWRFPSHGIPSRLIDSVENIEDAWFDGIETVGLSSGASAPEDLVQGVVAWMKRKYPEIEVEDWVTMREKVKFPLPPELAS